MACTSAASRTAALLVGAAILSPALAFAQPASWSRRWTLELRGVVESDTEYQTGCAPATGERVRLVVSAQRLEDGAERELSVAAVSTSGVLDSMTSISHAGDPLASVHHCLESGSGELMVVATTRSGAILVLESAGTGWKEDLVLGDGGYDVQLHDAAPLNDHRFVAVGAKKGRGFVVVFDTLDRTVDWRDWEGRTPSVIVDVEPRAGASTLCGLEADPSGELFTETSGVFVARLTESGSISEPVRMAGRACRLLSGPGLSASIGLLLEGGESMPGPLRLLGLGSSLEQASEQHLLDSIFFLYTLKVAQTSSSFAILNELPVRESIQVFSSAGGARIGSARLGVFPTGPLDLLAFGEGYLVVSHPLAAPSVGRWVRVEAYEPP